LVIINKEERYSLKTNKEERYSRNKEERCSRLPRYQLKGQKRNEDMQAAIELKCATYRHLNATPTGGRRFKRCGR